MGYADWGPPWPHPYVDTIYIFFFFFDDPFPRTLNTRNGNERPGLKPLEANPKPRGVGRGRRLTTF